MCLVCFSYSAKPPYRLLLAANRDEFFARPSQPIHIHDTEVAIIAGKDLRAGGTWLGVNQRGKMAAITNYRDPARNLPFAPSRGELVDHYLKSEASAAEFCAQLSEKAHLYNGFNLILLDEQSCLYFSSVKNEWRYLQSGVYALSNNLLDVPWPKVKRIKELFVHVLETQPFDTSYNALFSILADKEQPDDRDLPDTGVGLDWERLLGTVFISGKQYGTRSSSVMSISDTGEIVFIEKTFSHPLDNSKFSQVSLSMKITESLK